MRLLTSLKLSLGISLLLAVVYWGGSFYDSHFHSMSFMDAQTGLELDWSDPSQRGVASGFGDIEGIEFPNTEENREKVYGLWHIFKFIDVDGNEEAFDEKVRFNLVDDNLIRIGDTDQMFSIGHIYEDGTHLLFKKFEGGVEQIYARKVIIKEVAKVKKEQVKDKSAPIVSDDKPRGLIGFEDADLVLEKVYNPNKAKVVITGELVTGNLSIVGGSIQGFEANIQYAKDKFQTISIDYAQINDGGQFEYEYEKNGALEIGQGLISNSGKGAFKIRFATGPYMGAYLNFLTYEAWEEKEYQRELALEKAEEQGTEERMNNANRMVRDKIEEQTDAAQDRSQRAREDREYQGDETVLDVTPEEMATRLKKSGFAFGGKSKPTVIQSRGLASQY